MIPSYPDLAGLELTMRSELNPVLCPLEDGISEFTFASLYLFRHAYSYRVAMLDEGELLITGKDSSGSFFMLPNQEFSLKALRELFERFETMRCLSTEAAPVLSAMGYLVEEDRDNFDYVYKRSDMASLSGRKYHKKKNLVNAFVSRYSCEARPLTPEYVEDAQSVLEAWRQARNEPGDYEAAKEALELAEALALCGAVYYVDERPVAYTLGEEICSGTTFVIHFEKGIDGYKGLMQYVGKAFASILPETYEFINREQDLGLEGLRHAKESLHPVRFIKKFRAQRG